MNSFSMPSQWPDGVIVGQYISGPLVDQWVIVEAVDSIHGDAEPERYRVLATTLPITMDDGEPVLLPAEHSIRHDGSADVLSIMRRDLPIRWSTAPNDIAHAYDWSAKQNERIVSSLPEKERRFINYLKKHFSFRTGRR